MRSVIMRRLTLALAALGIVFGCNSVIDQVAKEASKGGGSSGSGGGATAGAGGTTSLDGFHSVESEFTDAPASPGGTGGVVVEGGEPVGEETRSFFTAFQIDPVREDSSGPKFVVASRSVFRQLMARIITNTLVSMHRQYNAKARSRASERGITSDSVLYLQPEVPVRSITEPPEKAARIEEEEWIDMAMELLDPLDQEVLHLRDAEDLSFPEIGECVGLKEDAARMRYKRAVQKLTRAVVMIKSGKLEAVLAGLEEEANG